jgi:DNA-binding transcriptional MocR family regulator
MTVRRVSSKYKCILVGPQGEDSRVGEEGRPQDRDPHRFGVDRATVKRYCRQLDERGTLESRKAPGNKPKLEKQARRLLVEDLRQRPWATHSQRTDEMGTHTSLAPVYAYSP